MRGLLFLALVALPLTASAATVATSSAPYVDPYQDGYTKCQSKDPVVRRQGADILGQLRRPEAAAVLLTIVNDPQAYVRSAVVNALGLIHAKDAVKPIVELLKSDKDASVRQSAATSLAYLGDPSAVDGLSAALSDPDTGVRYSALRTLGAMRATAAIPALAKLLLDPDIPTRRAAAAALSQFRSQAATAALRAAVNDGDGEVRMSAIGGIAAAPDAAAAPTLLNALKDPDVSVRLKAAQGLASIGISSGVPVALAALSESQPALRQRAAATLGQVGDAKIALAALDKAYKGEKDQVTRSVIDFSRAQLKSRFGIVDAKPEVVKSTGTATSPTGKAKGKGPAKKKKTPGKPTPAKAP